MSYLCLPFPYRLPFWYFPHKPTSAESRKNSILYVYNMSYLCLPLPYRLPFWYFSHKPTSAESRNSLREPFCFDRCAYAAGRSAAAGPLPAGNRKRRFFIACYAPVLHNIMMPLASFAGCAEVRLRMMPSVPDGAKAAHRQHA
jgi:hypothetical protein